MEYKNIEGFINYQVSNTGIVKNIKTDTIKKPCVKENGYLFTQLYKNNKSKCLYIHRLVAEAFIPNIENKPTVNHKDGDKTNNNVDNLEWNTYKENQQHAYDKGLNPTNGKKIGQYTLEGELVNIFKSACEASRITGISRSCIAGVLVNAPLKNNKSGQYKYILKTAGGYKWNFISS